MELELAKGQSLRKTRTRTQLAIFMKMPGSFVVMPFAATGVVQRRVVMGAQ